MYNTCVHVCRYARVWIFSAYVHTYSMSPLYWIHLSYSFLCTVVSHSFYMHWRKHRESYRGHGCIGDP